MTTTSTPSTGRSARPSGWLPVVITTFAIFSPALATPPANENDACDAVPAGTLSKKSEALARLKNSTFVGVGKSTSVNTAPNADTVAGVAPLVPGTEKVTVVTLLPLGVKIRIGLKAANVVA